MKYSLIKLASLALAMLVFSSHSMAQDGEAADNSLVPLLRGPLSAGNPYMDDWLAIDHWAYARISSGDVSYQLGRNNEPGFMALRVFIDNDGNMLPQLSARRMLHESLAAGNGNPLTGLVSVSVQGIVPDEVRTELEQRMGLLDASFHEPVPDWLAAASFNDAMLLPKGYVLTRRSTMREKLEQLRAENGGEIRDVDIDVAVNSYEYSLYGPDATLLGRSESVPALFFELAGMELPEGEGRLTEHGYFVFLGEEGSTIAEAYDYNLQYIEDGVMDTRRDSHHFSWLKQDEIRIMHAVESVGGK